MESSPTFLKWRASAFACVSFVSLLWIILLCIIVFARWGLLDPAEKGFLIVLLITNSINLFMLPTLILLKFRPWLDATRMLFLLLANTGLAAFFAYWNPKFRCPEQTADSKGVCQLINLYILLANWVNPGFLIAYSCCLAFWVWWCSRQPPSVATKSGFDDEASIGTGNPSTIPTTTIPERASSRNPSTLTLTILQTPVTASYRPPSRESFGCEYSDCGNRKKSVGDTKISRQSMSARLSKQRLPPSALY